MIRRSIRRMCSANEGGHNPNLQYDYMTLANACSIFGYQLNHRVEKKELKKRFNKLALQYHPDHGGTEKQFQTLLEAHKLLQNHRHDKGGTEGRYDFHRTPKPRDQTAKTAPTADNPFGEDTDDHKTFDRYDVLGFFVVMAAVVSYYFYHLIFINGELARTRARLIEEEMANPAALMHKRHDWHPWRASQDEKDQMEKVAVIQGSIREDIFRERAHVRGELAPSPFTVSR